MLGKLLSTAAVVVMVIAVAASVCLADLAEDITRVRDVFGIQMTDKPTTFEVRDNGMSNRVWHEGTVAEPGLLKLRGCGRLQSKDGDPVQFVRYSADEVAVKNLRTKQQCFAQVGPKPGD